MRCLRSLESLDKTPFTLETVVVDNHSDDGTAEMLESESKILTKVGLKLILNTSNLGLSIATEQAYEIASGEWILLCNPDVIFTDDFLRMVSFARSQDDYSMLTAEMVNEAGSIQRVVVRRFPTVARVFFGFSVFGSHVDKYLLGNFFLDDYTYARTDFNRVQVSCLSHETRLRGLVEYSRRSSLSGGMMWTLLKELTR